jgi:hypothetical protein
MFSSHKRFLILFLLTLLQCFAPLLHAHAHDVSVVGKVHLHGEGEVHTPAFLAHEFPGLPSIMADRDEAQVIAMAQEFRHDNTMALSGDPQPVMAMSFPEFLLSRPRQSEPASLVSPGGRCSYLSPFSQAPPSALI